MSARRTTRPMPTSSWRCSSNGAGTRISSASTSSTRRRSRPRVELVSPAACRARRAGAGGAGGPDVVATPPTRFRPTSPTRATATSPRPWSTSITECPTIMTRSRSAESTSSGKIVLARYGGGWRGLKPKLAQEHGAVGCLIYSDPADDSYAEADVYPRGGGAPGSGRPARLGRRHADLSRRSADARRRRHPERQAPDARPRRSTILKIPTLPISYGDATKIIAALDRARWSPASSAAVSASPITGAGPTRSRSISRSSPTGR